MSDEGPCEAVDLLPTEDDAIAEQCERPGRRVYERINDDRMRTRISCPLHAIDYDEVN
jgi:hypothetical protein